MLPIQLVIVSLEDWNIQAEFDFPCNEKKHAHMECGFCLDFTAFRRLWDAFRTDVNWGNSSMSVMLTAYSSFRFRNKEKFQIISYFFSHFRFQQPTILILIICIALTT